MSEYEYLALLPAGAGVSERWKARHRETGRIVTIKIVAGTFFNAAAESFLADSERLKTLAHPVLERVFDVGIKGGRGFHVTEYVEGASLSALSRPAAPWKEADVLAVTDMVAAALEYAWEAVRMYHGALRPEIIYLDASDRPRVLDLGLAWVLRRAFVAAGFQDPLRIVSRYAAPELVLGLGGPDAQSDMYSLGILMHQLLTGRPPFAESSDAEAMHRHVTGYLDDPRRAQAWISENTVQWIARLTAKDPAGRPTSWSEARQGLSAVRNGQPPPGPLPEEGGATVRREVPRARPSTLASIPAVVRRQLHRRTRRAVAPGAAPANGGSPRVVISRRLHRQSARVRAGARKSGSGLSIGLVIALAGAGAVYWRYFHPAVFGPAEELPRNTPEEIRLPEGMRRAGYLRPDGTLVTEPSEKRAPPSIPDSAPGRPAPEPARFLPMDDGLETEESPATASSRRPPHPDFLAGARAFNESLALFKRYQAQKDKSVLPRVEQLAQEAARRFEAYQNIAPDDAAVRRHVEHAYGMIRYARQAMLMEGMLGDNHEPSRNTRPQPRPSPSAASVLRLRPGWNAPAGAADPTAAELARLLSPHGSPSFDPAPRPDVVLLPGIPYLMPLKTLSEQRGVTASASRRLEGHAFPAGSFQWHALSEPLEPTFRRTAVLTDAENAVIGVHLSDDRPIERPTLPAVLFSERWAVCDFLAPVLRQDGRQRVAHRVRASGGVVQIDSEMAVADEAGEGRLGASIYRSRLILPQPVVNLMLMRLYVNQGGTAHGR